jgi:hypothetical protein
METVYCSKCGNKLGELVRVDEKITGLQVPSGVVLKCVGICNECHTPFRFTSSKYYVSGSGLGSST